MKKRRKSEERIGSRKDEIREELGNLRRQWRLGSRGRIGRRIDCHPISEFLFPILYS
jgi:hypothetical protein